MHRYRPSLAALLLVSLCAHALAADSNRVSGAVEPGANWVLVKFSAGGAGQAYWCHASDCLIRTYKGNSRGLNKETYKVPAQQTGNIYLPVKPGAPYYSLTSVPLFALVPVKDPLVKLSSYKALRAPWTARELQFDAASGELLGAAIDVNGLDYAATVDAKNILSAGDVVVGDADGTDPGKPMSLGVAAMASAGGGCKPGVYDEFYAPGDAGQFPRAFAPIEVLLERAGLEADLDSTRIRAHVQYGPPAPNGQKFDEVAKDIAKGNLSVAENYALYLHAVTRDAAKGYLRQTGATDDALSPFEQKFLGCMMGVAGKSDELAAAILAASGKPVDFASSARQFTQIELKRLVDANAGKPWPAPPSQLDLKTMDWKDQWNGLVGDARAWLDKRTLPSTTAFGGAKPTASGTNPTVVKKPVAAPGTADPTELSDRMKKALGD